LQYQTANAAEEQANSEALKAEQAKHVLGEQLFKADEHDKEDFTWKERHLKPGF